MSDSLNQARAQFESIPEKVAALKLARNQARAQFESVAKMVAALKRARDIDSGDFDWEAEARRLGAFPFGDDGAWHHDGPSYQAFDGAEEACRALWSDDIPDADAARQAIEEDALSVEVRLGWHLPGERGEPEEYRIMLCTGGPAVAIVGKIGAHGEPESARIVHQGWFTPWTDYRGDTDDQGALMFPGNLCPSDAESVLLAYARVFYFGE